MNDKYGIPLVPSPLSVLIRRETLESTVVMMMVMMMMPNYDNSVMKTLQ